MQSTEGSVPKFKSRKNLLSQTIFRDLEKEPEATPTTETSHRARALVSSPPATASETRQQVIDGVRGRSFIYRFLAKAFEPPHSKSWHWLSNPAIHTSFCSAVRNLELAESPLRRAAQELVLQLHPGQFEPFLEDYHSVFDPASPIACPMREGDYSALKTNPFQAPQSTRKADLTALLQEFGLELAGPAERQDHICTELEFMSVLTAKESYALERGWREQQAHCYSAQKKFVRQHLGQWIPIFCHRLLRRVSPGVLASLAKFTQAFVEAESQRFGLRPAHQDLLLPSTAPSLEKLYRRGDSLFP